MWNVSTQFMLNRQQLIPAPAGVCYLVIMVLCIFIAINFKKLNVLIKLCMETMSLDVTPLVTYEVAVISNVNPVVMLSCELLWCEYG